MTLLPALLAAHPALNSPWALNCGTHAEARKVLASALKECMREATCQGRRRRAGGQAAAAGQLQGMAALLQVDGCVFVGTMGEAGHVILCEDGQPLRVEHPILWGPGPSMQPHAAQPTLHGRHRGYANGGHLVEPSEVDDVAGPAPHMDGTVEPDVVPLVMSPRISFLVLASRGLLKVLSDQEVVSIVSGVLEDYSSPYSSGLAQSAAQELVESAADKPGAPHSIAAAVALVPWSP